MKTIKSIFFLSFSLFIISVFPQSKSKNQQKKVSYLVINFNNPIKLKSSEKQTEIKNEIFKIISDQGIVIIHDEKIDAYEPHKFYININISDSLKISARSVNILDNQIQEAYLPKEISSYSNESEIYIFIKNYIRKYLLNNNK